MSNIQHLRIFPIKCRGTINVKHLFSKGNLYRVCLSLKHKNRVFLRREPRAFLLHTYRPSHRRRKSDNWLRRLVSDRKVASVGWSDIQTCNAVIGGLHGYGK